MTLFNNEDYIKVTIDNSNKQIFEFDNDIEYILSGLIGHYCQLHTALASTSGDSVSYTDEDCKKIEESLEKSLKICSAEFGDIILHILSLATGAMDSSGINIEEKKEETLTIKFVVPKSQINN